MATAQEEYRDKIFNKENFIGNFRNPFKGVGNTIKNPNRIFSRYTFYKRIANIFNKENFIGNFRNPFKGVGNTMKNANSIFSARSHYKRIVDFFNKEKF